MNRRHFAQSLCLGVGLPLLGQSLAAQTSAVGSLSSATPTPPFTNEGIHHFKVGRIQCHSLLAGMMHTNLAQPFFGPELGAAEFSARTRKYTRNGRITLPYNVLLLEHSGKRVLIDAGPGGKHERVLPALAHLGLSPEDIDLVLLTHAHFDHQGGLLDSQGNRVFKKALHLTLRAEHDFWTGANPDLSQLRLPPDTVLRPARDIFSRIPFALLEPEASPLEGITCHQVPGHTPGHMTLTLSDSGETLYHISDLCHHAPSLLRNPQLSVGSDVDGKLAVQNRLRVFDSLAEKQTRSFGFHLPFPGLGTLVKEDSGYSWMAEDYVP